MRLSSIAEALQQRREQGYAIKLEALATLSSYPTEPINDTFTMALRLYKPRSSAVQSICTRLSRARRSFYRYIAAHVAQSLETS